MKKLKGFTLAEVLITLAIIGIIAAYTLPALNANIQAQKVGPALAKAVNTLENANKLALSENDARSLIDISDDYLDVLKMYIPGNSNITNGTVTYYLGNSNTAIVERLNRAYLSNDGMTYYVDQNYSTTSFSNENNNQKYNGNYFRVYVDVNGYRSKPNVTGKDFFYLIVDGKGSVIPFGGHEHAQYMEAAAQNGWSGTCEGKNFTSPENCAGSIADNGWKVIYR